MSMHDPLLRDIKGHLLKLHEESIKNPINDFHPNLMPFCQSIEAVLRKGLKRNATALGSTKQDYWVWISNLPVNYSRCGSWCHCARTDEDSSQCFLCSIPEKNISIFKAAIETTRKHPKLKTVQGRGRYFIRLSLQRHIISVPIILLIKNEDYRLKTFDIGTSLLGTLMAEVFISALQEADGLNFTFNLQNCSFLDETWLLPVYKIHEFVPCRHLGIKVGYVRGRAMAVSVTEGSAAAEDDIVEVGDILDELFGESLYECKRSKIPQLLKHNQRMPIQVNIAKGHYQTGELFPPAASIMRQLNLNVEALARDYRRKEMEKSNKEPAPTYDSIYDSAHEPLQQPRSDDLTNPGYAVIYVGSIDVGKDGSKDKITSGIMDTIKSSLQKQDVILETQETHIVVKDAKTNKILFEHCYTRIGACGRPKSPASYFAYTIGETTCSIANNFSCFVYQTTNPEVSREILLNIAKGFERTHWAV